MFTNSWKLTYIGFFFLPPPPPLLPLITTLGFFSSFSKAFDYIKVRHGVVIHKGQEQLGCSRCSSPLSLVFKYLVHQTHAFRKPSENSIGYIWVSNFGYKNGSQSFKFQFHKLLVYIVTHFN